jgi:large subunit ribosomal protein L28
MVSHSKRKTRRRFLPNVQHVGLLSQILGCNVRLRITASTLRSIEVNGGFDAYLLSTSNLKLTPEGVALKRRLKKAIAEQTAETSAA